MSEENRLETEPMDRYIDERFDPDRISQLCYDLFDNLGINNQIVDRDFVVAYVPADSPYADIPRSVETTVFAKAFHQTKGEVLRDYGKYDPASTFVSVIDVSNNRPVSAGALRITEYTEGLGFKDINDLLIDSSDNPWLGEIKQYYFQADEPYTPEIAWKRLAEAVGGNLELSESQDIATHAAAEEYRGKHGSIDGVSMLFFHSCLRYALATKTKNLLAIFDIKPFANLQQYGEPFDTYKGLTPHPYGGPYDTIPAFCRLEEGIDRIFRKDEIVGKVFRDGYLLDETALLPNEYIPELYSNQAIGLDGTPQ